MHQVVCEGTHSAAQSVLWTAGVKMQLAHYLSEEEVSKLWPPFQRDL